MKLTGKCKEAFELYLSKKEMSEHEAYGLNVGDLSEICYNAHIIDFFDSVGIKIFPYPIINSEDFDAVILHENRSEAINIRLTRLQATNEAIIKANTIYNHGKTS